MIESVKITLKTGEQKKVKIIWGARPQITY